MNQEIFEISEILEMLVEDLPLKAKAQVNVAIEMSKKDLDQEGLIKLQDQLELITNLSNIDSYTRNEVYNAISIIERLI